MAGYSSTVFLYNSFSHIIFIISILIIYFIIRRSENRRVKKLYLFLRRLKFDAIIVVYSSLDIVVSSSLSLKSSPFWWDKVAAFIGLLFEIFVGIYFMK